MHQQYQSGFHTGFFSFWGGGTFEQENRPMWSTPSLHAPPQKSTALRLVGFWQLKVELSQCPLCISPNCHYTLFLRQLWHHNFQNPWGGGGRPQGVPPLYETLLIYKRWKDSKWACFSTSLPLSPDVQWEKQTEMKSNAAFPRGEEGGGGCAPDTPPLYPSPPPIPCTVEDQQIMHAHSKKSVHFQECTNLGHSAVYKQFRSKLGNGLSTWNSFHAKLFWLLSRYTSTHVN